MNASGLFLSFEGTEGVGKSTQIDRLASALRSAGRDPLTTREPGGTELGRRLRPLLLDPEGPSISAEAELLLYLADRAQHIKQVISPALEAGRIVLCDRYLDATIAYQGAARGIPRETIAWFHTRPPLTLRPIRTVVLDMDPDVAVRRARTRNAAGRAAGNDNESRFDDEAIGFHRRVRAGYLESAAAEPRRITVVDANGDEGTVHGRVLAALVDLVPELEARA